MDWDGFGKRLRSLRQRRGWTQEDLAMAASTNHRSISQYEGGRICPRAKTIRRLADALGCPVEELTTASADRPSRPFRNLVQRIHGSRD